MLGFLHPFLRYLYILCVDVISHEASIRVNSCYRSASAADERIEDDFFFVGVELNEACWQFNRKRSGMVDAFC